jgi:ABC-type transport system substrate-binding protein
MKTRSGKPQTPHGASRRELVADDVKFAYDRFLTEKGNANRFLLEPVDRVEVVDRYTVKFVLKEPFIWPVDTLAFPWTMWIVAPELVSTMEI